MAEKLEPTQNLTGTTPAWRRRLCNRWTLAGGLTLILYALVGFFLAPWLLDRALHRYTGEQLGCRLELGKVRINPFLLTLEARDFHLADADNAPLLDFPRLLVDLEAESLFRWAWTFAEISLEAPVAHLVIDQAGHLNWGRLLDRLEKNPDPATTENENPAPVRLLFKHIGLHGGSIHLRDHSGRVPAAATLSTLDLLLQGLTTLPDRSSTGSLHASLPEGGRFDWQGEGTIVPLASRGTLQIEDFQPAVLWEFFQDRVTLDRPEGRARLGLSYRFAQAGGRTDFVVEPLVFQLHDLVVRQTQQAPPLIQLAALEVLGAGFDLAGHELRLPSIGLRQGECRAEMDEQGLLDWLRLQVPSARQKIIAAAAGQEGPAPAPANSPPWRVRLDTLSLAEIALHYTDRSRAHPYSLEVGDSALTLAASTEIGTGPSALQVNNLSLQLRQLSARAEGEDKPLWNLAEASLQGGSVSLPQHRFQAQSLKLNGGQAEVARGAGGTLRPFAIFAQAPQKTEDTPAAATPAPAAPDWRFLLARLELAGFNLDYVDQGLNPALQYGLRDLNLTAEGIDTAGAEPVRVAARAGVAQGGTLVAEGTLAQQLETFDSRIKVDRLALRPLEPLLQKYARLNLTSGDLSLESRLQYQAGPSIKSSGRTTIADLLLQESSGGEPVLAWQEMAANGIDFTMTPDARGLVIDDILLRQPLAKIEIAKEKDVNLARIFKKQAAPAATPEAAPPAPPVAEAEEPPFPLQVDRVRVDNGEVDFADLSLVLPYSAQIERFTGTALNIGTDATDRTTLKFSGQVAPYGQVGVDGSLAPLAPRNFSDIKVNFRNVELQPVSPFTATFAGRRIASGRMDLNLDYKIANSELQGDHRVVLRDLSLGETVESPNAVSLPLDLAIALLTDADGKIDVAVPVRGDLNNPKFSYGQVVWQTVRNLLSKIVTAPFQALGALFGSGTSQPDKIFFDPGLAELSPPEREKLQQVAKVLGQRPQLSLTVHGAFDRDLDGTSLRDLAVRRALASQLGLTLQPGEDPGPVAFDRGKTQRALEELAGGAGPVAEFQAAYETRTGAKAGRVNPALALLGRGSDDLEFYRALFRHLVENTPPAEQELHDLATARRDEVLRALTGETGVTPERLTAGSVAEVPAGAQQVPLPLELGAMPPPVKSKSISQ